MVSITMTRLNTESDTCYQWHDCATVITHRAVSGSWWGVTAPPTTSPCTSMCSLWTHLLSGSTPRHPQALKTPSTSGSRKIKPGSSLSSGWTRTWRWVHETKNASVSGQKYELSRRACCVFVWSEVITHVHSIMMTSGYFISIGFWWPVRSSIQMASTTGVD